jgi:S1-C subfamily serine protease
MYRFSGFLAAVIVVAAWVQPATAKSAVEIGQIAKAITIEIQAVNADSIGSGILLQQQGDVYTVLTAAHVVNGGSNFTLKTVDGELHKSLPRSVKVAPSSLDLGILKFKSSKQYNLAKLGKSVSLQELSPIYVAGFPASTHAIEAGIINITKGEVIGNANRGNALGYSLIYSNMTRPGMSGGPVLDESGELVAIHGQGDREGTGGRGEKTGRNLGIVVERFGAIAVSLGVQLEQQVAKLPANSTLNSSDYYLRGSGKLERGDLTGVVDLGRATLKNPRLLTNDVRQTVTGLQNKK